MKLKLLLAALVASTYSTLFPSPGNYIRNGDFAENYLGLGKSAIGKTLPGWETRAEVEPGSPHNPNWGDTVVVELDCNKKDSLRQKIDLEYGPYTLKLQYAA